MDLIIAILLIVSVLFLGSMALQHADYLYKRYHARKGQIKQYTIVAMKNKETNEIQIGRIITYQPHVIQLLINMNPDNWEVVKKGTDLEP